MLYWLSKFPQFRRRQAKIRRWFMIHPIGKRLLIAFAPLVVNIQGLRRNPGDPKTLYMSFSGSWSPVYTASVCFAGCATYMMTTLMPSLASNRMGLPVDSLPPPPWIEFSCLIFLLSVVGILIIGYSKWVYNRTWLVIFPRSGEPSQFCTPDYFVLMTSSRAFWIGVMAGGFSWLGGALGILPAAGPSDPLSRLISTYPNVAPLMVAGAIVLFMNLSQKRQKESRTYLFPIWWQRGIVIGFPIFAALVLHSVLTLIQRLG